MAKTPLQILVSSLGGDPQGGTETLKKRARSLAKNRREREVAQYLIKAAEGRLPRSQKAGGSLKHVLWWLRDHAGDAYEAAAAEVLRATLHSRWPLQNALPNLAHLPILGVYLDGLQQATDWKKLTAALQERRIGRWRVAVNTTPLNLTGPAMRAGYDVMVAHSEHGVVVKARRGLVVNPQHLPQPSGWAHPYPDLAIWDAGEPPSLDETLKAIPSCLRKK